MIIGDDSNQQSRFDGGGRLSWELRGNRFELQLVDPGCTLDFVIKFHGEPADHLDPEKPGVRCNYKIAIDAGPRAASGELSEDVILTRRQFSIGNSKTDSLIGGQSFRTDKRGTDKRRIARALLSVPAHGQEAATTTPVSDQDLSTSVSRPKTRTY